MMKRKIREQIPLHIFFIILSVVFLYPFLLLVGASLSEEKDVIEFGYSVIPKHFSLNAYKFIFADAHKIVQAYKVTAFYSVIGTGLAVLLQAMIAYPLSKKNLKGRNFISFYLYFTMLFSGGMVADYIIRTQVYHLQNSMLVYILPGLVGAWSVFMMRTFFQGIPNEIFEAVCVDGGNEFMTFFRFVLPLSKPVLATVALTTFLGKWNDWYTSMLYISDENMISLQYLLQKMLQNMELIKQMSGNANVSSMISGSSTGQIPSETVRMAMAIIVAGPTFIIFPFFQKYFVRGLTIGSVKG